MAVDLRHLLHPVTPESFVRKHWAARSLYIPGKPSKFRALGFGSKALRALWSGPTPPPLIKAQYFDAAGLHRELDITPALIDPLFQAGMTICFASLHRGHPGLARLLSEVKLGLNFPDRVVVNGYWSPDGAGFGLHFDMFPTFIIQLEGSKRWRYSAEPLVEFPPQNLLLGDAREVASFRRENPWARFKIPDEATLLDQVLRPGDVLYLPPGALHRTYADGVSLGLAVVCAPTNVLDLIWLHLSQTMRKHPAWRQPVPVFTSRPPHEPPFPPDTERFLSERFRELGHLVRGWTPGTLANSYFTAVSSFELPEAPAEPASPIRRNQRFEVPAPVTCVVTEDGEERALHVFAGNKRLSMPLTAQSFVRRLARRRSFRAEEAMAWSGSRSRLVWGEVREALEVLLERGVIRRSRP